METIHIVGAGPAGLMAAQQFAQKGHPVTVYDHKPAAGRKFLVAGNGGFNLTHSEDIEIFLSRYDCQEIQSIVRNFTNDDTIRWLSSLGIPTYTGSSGKVFPKKGIKPIEVLQQWLSALKALNVAFKFKHRLIDFDQSKIVFSVNSDKEEIHYKRAVFAVGGKSWSKTGSDGSWIPLFESKGIEVAAVEPANSGLSVAKPLGHAGVPLKNIRLFNFLAEKYGECVLTDYGLEGSAVYFMNRYVRKNSFPQTLFLDLKPQFSFEQIASLLAEGNISDSLRKRLRLEPIKINLLKALPKDIYTDQKTLAQVIKKFPLSITGFRPIDEVISTSGGVSWTELDSDLSLKKFPNIQCCGEMLDWDAPTGGYLLQACFASGYYLANCSPIKSDQSSYGL